MVEWCTWANNDACKIIGLRSVYLKMKDGSTKLLRNVRHVPNLKRNLISLAMLDSIGCTTQGSNGEIQIIKDSKVVLVGEVRNGVYVIKDVEATQYALTATSTQLTEGDMWHKRLSHISNKGIEELTKQGILPTGISKEMSFCEHCLMGKSKRHGFTKAQHSTKEILDYVHSDLWGPAHTTSLSGSRHFISLIDDYSRKCWVYFLKSKDEVFTKFKEWKSLIENKTSKKIKVLRTDNGLEFCGEEFNLFCRQNGIERHKTVRYTPQQNGVAERLNRTIMERTRSLISDSMISERFWAQAVSYVVFTINRSLP